MKTFTIKIDGQNYGGESSSETQKVSAGLRPGFSCNTERSVSALIIGEEAYRIRAEINLRSHLQKIFDARVPFQKIEIECIEDK
jgi:hypothetical protein